MVVLTFVVVVLSLVRSRSAMSVNTPEKGFVVILKQW